MEIEHIQEGFVRILIYPETAMRIGRACMRAADNDEQMDFMLTIGSALQSAAMAAWSPVRSRADGEALTLADLRAQMLKEKVPA